MIIAAVHLKSNVITFPRISDIAFFKFLSLQQAETLTPIDQLLLTLAKFRNPDGFVQEKGQLLVDENFNADSRSKPEHKKFRLPTPETCKNPEKLQGAEEQLHRTSETSTKGLEIDPKTDDNC